MDTTAQVRGAASLDILSSDAPDAGQAPRRARTLSRAGWVLAVVGVLALAVPAAAVYTKRAELLRDLERREEILARGRAEVFETWLDGVVRPIGRVVESEMFRLFATEVHMSGDDISDLVAGAPPPSQSKAPDGTNVPLSAQIPFMSQVLTDFARSEKFEAGYLFNGDGVAYVTSAGAPEASAEQRAIARRAFQAGALTFGPVRATPGGLVLDIFAPILPAQTENGTDKPVGVALLTTPVSARLGELLAPPPLSEPGERLRLVQAVDGGAVEVAPHAVPPLRPIAAFETDPGEHGIPFARRAGIGGDAAVYSVGVAVGGPAWWVVQEIDAKAFGKRLGGFIATVAVVTVLIVLSIAAAFGAFWWRMANEHSAALAKQYRRLAARIDAQKRLLDSINNTITDHIGLKSPDGAYRYVNPAFARAIGREVDEAIGLDDAAIFGRGTADRLRYSDQRALASGAPVTVNEDVYLSDKLHHLQISKIPYRDDEGETTGVVSVTRDVTELVEEQKKRERAVRQSVAALVRAVELRDPYLAGHSRRVAGFAAATARRMGLSPEDVATVEIAANLSQIGKLAVPREILNKPDRLEPDEIEQMQDHLSHAIEVLKDIDFELPVVETIAAMHERLDGGGYPKGLAGEQIPLTARIVGACDVFCARIEPRSYRRGIPPEEALAIMTQNTGRYDPAVVAALAEATRSVGGEKLMADLEVT